MKKILIMSSILVCLLLLCNITNIVNTFTIYNGYWYHWNTTIDESNTLGENIYQINKPDRMSIYTNGYQNAVTKKIATLLDKSSDALLLYNPYGTNSASFYYTFKSDEQYDIQYKIEIEEQNIKDYVQTAKQHKITDNTYAYQLIGFVSGLENQLTISYLKDDKIVKEDTYMIHMPTSENQQNIILNTSKGSSKQNLNNGLYAVFGLDKSFNSNIYLYDNDGVLRSEYVLSNYRSDQLLTIDDDILYAYKKNGFIKVNSLGRITNIYNFNDYKQHHDFIYDEKNNKLLILANEENTDTIEDVIISLNLTNNKVEKIIDMKELLPLLYEKAVLPEEGNTYGGEELDWIHLNSLSLIDNSLIVSSREISTIIKIDDIYKKPSIDYLIADPSLYKESEYQSLLLNKKGDFISQAGQHSVQYIPDETLEDEQYYLDLYNNNFTSARTRQDLDWSAFPNSGTYKKGNNSYYYRYLVDEENNNYSLVKSVALPYSSVVSNVQSYQNHLISSSGMSHCFNEYDENGELIQQFTYNAEKYAYRIMKYDLNSFYFR